MVNPRERGITQGHEIKPTHRLSREDIEHIAMLTGGTYSTLPQRFPPSYDPKAVLERITYPAMNATLDIVRGARRIGFNYPPEELRVDSNTFRIGGAVVIGDESVDFVDTPIRSEDREFVSFLTIRKGKVTFEKTARTEVTRPEIIEAAEIFDEARKGVRSRLQS